MRWNLCLGPNLRTTTFSILVVPDRYHTGTHGTSTKPVRVVSVLIGTHNTGTDTDAMGRTRQPDRHRVNRIDHESRQATGQRRVVCDKEQLNRDRQQGQSALGISCRGNSSPPRTRRSARPPARSPLPLLDPALARSLLRCPPALPHPSRFIIPPSTP